jgi:hypothetical protein
MVRTASCLTPTAGWCSRRYPLTGIPSRQARPSTGLPTKVIGAAEVVVVVAADLALVYSVATKGLPGWRRDPADGRGRSLSDSFKWG